GWVGGWVGGWVAGDAEEAVRMCCEDLPDLLLMDMLMPGMDAGAPDVVAAPSLGPQQTLDFANVRRKPHKIAWMIGRKVSHTPPSAPRRRPDLAGGAAAAGAPASCWCSTWTKCYARSAKHCAPVAAALPTWRHATVARSSRSSCPAPAREAHAC